jgi:hypothetical protein
MPIAVLAPLDRLKMYTPNKQTSAVTPSPPAVDFYPFVPQRISRKGRKSTVSGRQKEKSKSVPTDLLTCVEVRTIEDATHLYCSIALSRSHWVYLGPFARKVCGIVVLA